MLLDPHRFPLFYSSPIPTPRNYNDSLHCTKPTPSLYFFMFPPYVAIMVDWALRTNYLSITLVIFFFPFQDIGAGKGKYYAVNYPLRDGIDDDSFESIFKPVGCCLFVNMEIPLLRF